jgi:hypothetical protein
MNDEQLIWEAYENSQSASEIVKAAITNSKEKMSDYWGNTLKQRSVKSDMVAGSRYDMSPEQIENALLNANWSPYQHENVKEPAKAYKANTGISGYEGIIKLSTLPKDKKVVLDDRKNTGKLSVVVDGVLGKKVDFTVILIGPHEGNEVVWTFHPGEPIMPSIVEAGTDMNGKEITVQEAIEMGFEYAKLK